MGPGGCHAAGFDAVFSDVMIPGMNGVELGREIRRRFLNLPVVLASAGFKARAASALPARP